MADNVSVNTSTNGVSAPIASDEIGGIQYQRVKIVTGSDGVNEGDVSNSHGLPISKAPFVFSTLNSTISQLAQSSSFIGTTESIGSYQTASIIATCDKNCTFTVFQYLDSGATQLSNSWQFQIVANIPFSKNISLNGNYIKIVLTNNDLSATTTLNFDVSYGSGSPTNQLGNLTVSLADVSGVAINGSVPITGDSDYLLRRIIKLLETQSATDSGQRQRITLDAISGALTLATVSTVTTVGAVTSITNALPTGANTIGNVTVGGMDDKMYIDVARTAYANGIRQFLTFA